MVINDWEETYQNTAPEELPWYAKELDPDLAAVLPAEGTFLDLGTGEGSQAAALARRFTVTATDLSATAIKQAKRFPGITFLQDDITKTKLKEQFDYAFDRGCFHTLPPERRAVYVKNVHHLVKKTLFLKCFSDEEPGEEGPFRLSPAEIKSIFNESFIIDSIERTTFQVPTQPKALFIVMRPR